MLYDDIIEDKEQLSFSNQVQIQNRIWIKNPWRRTVFEFDWNLLGIQTCLEKSDKFLKIRIYLGLPEYEFRLAWLHDKIWDSIDALDDLV
jgi:hypothetical protein